MYRIELCDGVGVHWSEAKITKFRTQKAARLLAYLTLHPGNHSRERLIELFWPELGLDAARNALSTTLLYLKKPLERELGQPEGSLIRATRTTIGLVPTSFTTDLESLPSGDAGDGAGGIRAAPGDLDTVSRPRREPGASP